MSWVAGWFSGIQLDRQILMFSLVLNPKSPFYNTFKHLLTSLSQWFQSCLWPTDVVVLERNSRDVHERIRQINETAEQLCDTLQQHPRGTLVISWLVYGYSFVVVACVYYPKYMDRDVYNSFRRPDGGYGGLFSLVLRSSDNSDREAKHFYDHLSIKKGPSLGTNFTLACPYTLLAHYNELDDVQRFGVDRTLIRVSVGLQPIDELIDIFTRALDLLN